MFHTAWKFIKEASILPAIKNWVKYPLKFISPNNTSVIVKKGRDYKMSSAWFSIQTGLQKQKVSSHCSTFWRGTAFQENNMTLLRGIWDAAIGSRRKRPGSFAVKELQQKHFCIKRMCSKEQDMQNIDLFQKLPGVGKEHNWWGHAERSLQVSVVLLHQIRDMT